MTTDAPIPYSDFSDSLGYDACMVVETANAARVVLGRLQEGDAAAEELMTTLAYQLENMRRQALALACRICDSESTYTLKENEHV